jgi:hypothetical protein
MLLSYQALVVWYSAQGQAYGGTVRLIVNQRISSAGCGTSAQCLENRIFPPTLQIRDRLEFGSRAKVKMEKLRSKGEKSGCLVLFSEPNDDPHELQPQHPVLKNQYPTCLARNID